MKTEIKLIKGDCLNSLRKLPDRCIDVIVTSPPYNIGIKYDYHNDLQSNVDYLRFMDRVIVECKRVLKNKGSLFINVAGTSRNPYLPMTLPLQISNHMVLQNHIIWIKAITVKDISHGHYKPVNSERYVNNLHESLFHFTKTGKVKLDRLSIGAPYVDKNNIKRRQHVKDLKCIGNTWAIFTPTRTSKLKHPASFPVELPEKCIKLHGKKHPVVLDPFAGICSTGVAAIACKAKKFIGMDISKDYLTIGKERMENLT